MLLPELCGCLKQFEPVWQVCRRAVEQCCGRLRGAKLSGLPRIYCRYVNVLTLYDIKHTCCDKSVLSRRGYGSYSLFLCSFYCNALRHSSLNTAFCQHHNRSRVSKNRISSYWCLFVFMKQNVIYERMVLFIAVLPEDILDTFMIASYFLLHY